MSTGSIVESTLERLREALRSIAPEALLIEPRILRRVIRLDRRLAGLGMAIPHSQCYIIETARLLAYVEWDEIKLPPNSDLPWKVILLAEPVLESLPSTRVPSMGAWNEAYSRHLFHARVHMELERKFPAIEATDEEIQTRIAQIGRLPFAEIKAVLLRDDQLFPEPSDREVYLEFCAHYLDLMYGNLQDRQWHFPGITDWSVIEAMVDAELNHAELWRQSQLAIPELPGRTVSQAQPSRAPAQLAPPSGLRSQAKKQLSRALRAVSRGNSIRAAILRTRLAAEGDAVENGQAALAELQRVIQRLQPILHISDADVPRWTSACEPLLIPATQEFWAIEARLLYDLQKVCVEYERGVFQVNLIGWCLTFGKLPLRIPLPLLREVLITKHLRSALRRVASARIETAQREQLANILREATERAEQLARDRIRPLIADIFERVGLIPQNVPELVARRNVVEELLDHIVEQGVANLGHLRDSLSKNDIKLPDLAGPNELLRGDLLLRIDRQLGRELGGIYRPGAIYLRSTQRLSSIAFGTPPGRWLTRYVAIPYGGAYVILEFLRHLIVLARKPAATHSTTLESVAVASHGGVHSEGLLHHPSLILGATFLLGTWLLLLLHYPSFRSWFVELLWGIWRVIRIAVLDIPSVIARSALVRDVLQSPAYAAFRSYLLVPSLVTLLARVVVGRPWSKHVWLEIFLATAVFLNSRVGRYVEECVGDILIRAWHELRFKIFAALFDWVMDVFHRVFVALERIVYTVDEFLRFRAGDTRFVGGIKLLASTFWVFISYIVVFVFTLLVEPQINPIKHFPVVTVSHKLLITAAPAVVKQLALYIGTTRANTLVWSTIWLIPGVFGFLVWELKENWRLYAANRSRLLSPVSVGHHGESMLQLLRVGFHSGTIPRLFHQARRALRRGHATGDWKPFQRKQAALHHVEEALRRFVERKLIWLWLASPPLAGWKPRIVATRLATNRLEVSMAFQSNALSCSPSTLCLEWQEQEGSLVAFARLASQAGDEPTHPLASQATQPAPCELPHLFESPQLVMSVSGIIQMSAADQGEAPWPIPAAISWDEWVAFWTPPSWLTEGPQQKVQPGRD